MERRSERTDACFQEKIQDGDENCQEKMIATVFGKEKFKTVFPLITKDFIKMMIGLGASVGVVLAIHYIIVPNGL